MIVEIGHFALVLALSMSFVQGTLPIIGAHYNKQTWMALARPTALLQLMLILISFVALTIAFLGSDFSLKIVVNNSHTLKPLLYKISGVWGNHEGSMLLWVLILAIYGGAIATWGKNLRPALRARVLSIQGLLGFGFMLFILFTSNPFDRISPAPINGQDLNPLLQDPGLAFHPPLLYLGYVGLSTTFSFAVAALIEGKVDPVWARWVRPWALVAWGFLTSGIVLGSWWAYYELGWGGWWFWDPVENASFMPWLAATALLHSAIVLEKRDTLKSWTVFLAIIAFALSILGTFIVRSGVITSVHAFASDPGRGVFILALLVISIGTAFVLFGWRAPLLKGSNLFQPISREGGLLINNFLLTVASASILLGTLYPLFIDVLELGKISVGAPYFNAVFVPLMTPMILIMGLAPFMTWKRADILVGMSKLKIAGILSILVFIGVWFIKDKATVLASFGIGVSAWLFLATLSELKNRINLFGIPFKESINKLFRQPRGSWGMTLAHSGLAIAVAGMTASSAWKVESIQNMNTGNSINVAGYEFKLEDVRQVRGPNYMATRGIFAVSKHNSDKIIMKPEKRIYAVSQQPTTEAAIEPTLLGDLYIVIGDKNKDGSYITRIYFNPLVPWMWFGAILMVLGSIVSLTDRRYRIGTPSSRKMLRQSTSDPVESINK